MKIAYVMKRYQVSSELWMERQLEFLADSISFIGTTDGKHKKWRGKVPVISLYDSYPFLKKLLMRLGLLKKREPTYRYNEVLKNSVEKYNSDVIFVNFLTLAYELKDFLLETKCPLVIHTHGYDITWDFLSPETDQAVYGDDYFQFVREIGRKAIIIANSQASRSKLIDIGVPEESVRIKYFGVELQDHPPQESATKKSTVILYLGRLVPFKGPDLTIKAFERACEKGLDGTLIIAGGGPMEYACRLLRARSKYRDRIELVGVVSRQKGEELRRSADIFTAHNCKCQLTNQEEAFGVSIIEAMGSGLPVVTGRSGGVVDSIVHGETGFLFEPGDIEAHANFFLELSQDPSVRYQMGREAMKRAAEKFNLEQEKTAMIDVFSEARGLS